MKIAKYDAIPLCPWQLTLDNGQTAHFQTKEQAQGYEAYLTKTQSEVNKND